MTNIGQPEQSSNSDHRAAHPAEEKSPPSKKSAPNAVALPPVDEDQEVAFWDDLLKAKAESTDDLNGESSANTAAAPSSSQKLVPRQRSHRKTYISSSRQLAAENNKGVAHFILVS